MLIFGTEASDLSVFYGAFSAVSECTAGRFGPDCQQECECENGGQCDKQTGRCVCGPGWIGQRCEKGRDRDRWDYDPVLLFYG